MHVILDVMSMIKVFRDYLLWHYTVAYLDILYIWWNYLWFVNHIFSVPDVLRSWVSPFKRLQEDRVNILKNPEDFFANLFVNIIMRIVGFIIRTALLFIASCFFVIVFIFGIVFVLLWTILPILVGYFFINGIQLLFS